MTINASLTGRLRNTKLPKSNALLPLFEAVVNAIQAVDEAHAADMDSTRIEIRILRGQQEAFDFSGERQLEPITGFVVSDNGEGFHDQNMKSFELLDSEYRADIGCRGVGRLLWLKAFDKVEVASRYLDINMKERGFVFTARDVVCPTRPCRTRWLRRPEATLDCSVFANRIGNMHRRAPCRSRIAFLSTASVFHSARGSPEHIGGRRQPAGGLGHAVRGLYGYLVSARHDDGQGPSV